MAVMVALTISFVFRVGIYNCARGLHKSILNSQMTLRSGH